MPSDRHAESWRSRLVHAEHVEPRSKGDVIKGQMSSLKANSTVRELRANLVNTRANQAKVMSVVRGVYANS